MLSASRIFTRQYSSFKQNLNSKTIKEYFNIIQSHGKSLKFKLAKEMDNCTLIIEYYMAIKPIEQEGKIDLSEILVKVELTMYISPEYPFKPPIWCVKNINNIDNDIKLIYENIVNSFNEGRDMNTTVIGLEQEILNIIIQIKNSGLI